LKRVIGSIGKVRRSRRFIPVVSAGPQHQPGIKLALKVGESKVKGFSGILLSISYIITNY
jgi:hypothetical protein